MGTGAELSGASFLDTTKSREHQLAQEAAAPAGGTVKMYLLGLCTFRFQSSQTPGNSRVCSQILPFGSSFPAGAWGTGELRGARNTIGSENCVHG